MCWQDMRASVVMAEVSQVSPEPVCFTFSARLEDQTIDIQQCCSGLDHLRRAPQAETAMPDMTLAGVAAASWT